MLFCQSADRRSLRVLLLSFCFLFSIHAHSAPSMLRFIDFLVTDSGMMEALTKNGVRAEEAMRRRDSIIPLRNAPGNLIRSESCINAVTPFL